MSKENAAQKSGMSTCFRASIWIYLIQWSSRIDYIYYLFLFLKQGLCAYGVEIKKFC